MVISTQQLKVKYSNYSDVLGKISRDIKQGKLFPIVKGLYDTNCNTPGFLLAQFIYAPSYMSFDYVLYKEGLIPEAVYNTFTCATYNKRKIKTYKNHFGTYIYRDVPKRTFQFEVNIVIEGNYSYHIATPEKALCDKLYIMKPVNNINALKKMLFEDLRIDIDAFNNLNKNVIIQLAPMYHSTNLTLLVKLLKKRK